MDADLERQISNCRIIWGIIMAALLVDVLAMPYLGLSFVWSSAYKIIGAVVLLSLLSAVYTHFRPDMLVRMGAQNAMQLLMCTAAFGILIYVGAALRFPLIDERLIAWDAMMGFRWRHYINWTNQYPWLSLILKYTYSSVMPQIIIGMLLLYLMGKTATVQRFVIGFILSIGLTTVIASLWPAVGGYVFYNIDIRQYPNLYAHAARVHEKDLLGLRAGVMREISMQMQGLITFPSFHSSLGILLIEAARSVKWLLPLTATVNILMLFSTPVHGGHYLSDVIGGIIVAVFAIGYARKLCPNPAHSHITYSTAS